MDVAPGARRRGEAHERLRLDPVQKDHPPVVDRAKVGSEIRPLEELGQEWPRCAHDIELGDVGDAQLIEPHSDGIAVALALGDDLMPLKNHQDHEGSRLRYANRQMDLGRGQLILRPGEQVEDRNRLVERRDVVLPHAPPLQWADEPYPQPRRGHEMSLRSRRDAAHRCFASTKWVQNIKRSLARQSTDSTLSARAQPAVWQVASQLPAIPNPSAHPLDCGKTRGSVPPGGIWRLVIIGAARRGWCRAGPSSVGGSPCYAPGSSTCSSQW